MISAHLGDSAHMQAFIETVAESKPADVGGDDTIGAHNEVDSSGKIRQIMCDLCGQYEKVVFFKKISHFLFLSHR